MTPEITIAQSPNARSVSGEAREFSVVKTFKRVLAHVLRDEQELDDTTLVEILDEIESYRNVENEDGYVLGATPVARAKARTYMIYAYRALLRDFPVPKIEPDGEGGLVFDWRNNGKIVRLACRSSATQKNYIYYQSRKRHAAEPFSDMTLLYRLLWVSR